MYPFIGTLKINGCNRRGNNSNFLCTLALKMTVYNVMYDTHIHTLTLFVTSLMYNKYSVQYCNFNLNYSITDHKYITEQHITYANSQEEITLFHIIF